MIKTIVYKPMFDLLSKAQKTSKLTITKKARIDRNVLLSAVNDGYLISVGEGKYLLTDLGARVWADTNAVYQEHAEKGLIK